MASEEAPDEATVHTLELRAKVAAELLATERTYCAALTALVAEFLLPIRGEGLLKAADVETVFSNVEEIQNLHMPVLHDLELVLREWGDGSCIGAAFARLVPYLKLYKAYCANYHAAVRRLEAKSESSGKLAAFLEGQREAGRNLGSLLIQPIQRIPRYRLLFGELVKFTPASHADYGPTRECLIKIEEIAVYVNESVRERDNQAKLAAIQASLTGSKLPELVKPFRRFLKEGTLVKLCRKIPKRRYFFLFNDLLVYTTASDAEKAEKQTYAFHRSLDLMHVKVSGLDDSGKISNAFQVYSNQKSFTVFAGSPEDKAEWIEAINDAIGLCRELQASMKVLALDGSQVPAQQQQDGGVAPVWVPDKLLKRCMLCDAKFTTLNRRHHCRKCGKLVCNGCSGKKFKLPNIGKTCRVCDCCYSELTGEPLAADEKAKGAKAKAQAKERRESGVPGASPEDLQQAELSLAKRATQKFRAESARPASGIGPYREQLAAPRAKPQSLVLPHPLRAADGPPAEEDADADAAAAAAAAAAASPPAAAAVAQPQAAAAQPQTEHQHSHVVEEAPGQATAVPERRHAPATPAAPTKGASPFTAEYERREKAPIDTIEVVGNRLIDDGTDSPFHLYEIEVKLTTGSSWIVFKRFKQLRQFHGCIQHFPICKGLAPIPSTPFFSRKLNLVDQRTRELSAYFKDLLQVAELQDTHAFQDFFEVPMVGTEARQFRILFPLPDKDFDPTECAVPWKKMRQHGGFSFTFATENAAVAEADQMQLRKEAVLFGALGADFEAKLFYTEMAASAEFNNPIRYADIQPEDYDGLWLTGGHAKGMRQYLESEALQQKIVPFMLENKPVAAICHGSLLLARCKNLENENKSILYHRRTCTLSKTLERLGYAVTAWKHGDLYRTYEEYCEDEVRRHLKDAGVQFDSGPFSLGLTKGTPYDDGAAFVVDDGNYVSARWPGDAYLLAAKFMQLFHW